MCFAQPSGDLTARYPSSHHPGDFCCDGQPLTLPHAGLGLRHFNDDEERERYAAYCRGQYEAAPREGDFWLRELVACDGHTLAVIHDAEGSIEGADAAIVKISPALFAAARTASARKNAVMKHRVLVKGSRVSIAPAFELEGSDFEHYIQPGRAIIEGKYPEWRKVMPNFDNLKRGGFLGCNAVNATYLARLDRIDSSSEDRYGGKGVTLWQEEANKAVVCQVKAVPELLVVIMPMHGEEDAYQRSLFAPFILQKAAPASQESEEKATA